MNKLFSLLLLGLLAIGFLLSVSAEEAAAETTTTPSDVVVLTSENFSDVLSQSEYVLVEFYAPWCGHCQKLAPEYERAATELKKSGITVAKVDCDKESKIAQDNQIAGFPTLKLFKNGKFFRDYDDDRTADAIAKWVVKKTGPSVKSLTTAEDLENFVKTETDEETEYAVVVGFFDSKDSQAYKDFATASDDSELEEFDFAEVVGDAIKSFNVPSGTVRLYRNFEPKQYDIQNVAALKSEVLANGYPLVDEVNGKTFRRFMSANLPLAVAFIDPEQAEVKQTVLATLNAAASALKGKFNFGWSDGKVYGQQLTNMGGDASKMPGLAAMIIEKRQNFPFPADKEMTAENVQQWAEGILSGDIKPHMRSQPIPEKNNKTVKVVVGKSFDEIVMDSSKDVLLEFYAPWCGHCKKLAPIYKKLAKQLKNASNLVVAKIDASQNDSPISIQGFPTIYFFPSNNKGSPIQYEGDRSLEDMKQFVVKNAVAAKEQLEAAAQKTEL